MKKFALLTLLCLFSCQQGIDIKSEAAAAAVEATRVNVDNSKYYYITVYDDTYCTVEFNNGKRVSCIIIDWEVEHPTLTITLFQEIHLIRLLHSLYVAGIKYTFKRAAWYNPLGFHYVYIPVEQVRRKY